MNPERKFVWQERVYDFLVSVQLFIERFIPQKHTEILDTSQMNKTFSEIWNDEFAKIYMDE